MHPFRILFMGDFSGRGNRLKEAQELNGRKPLRIDRDRIGPVLSHLNTELHLTDIPGSPDLTLEFRGLDDFHPDWIRLPERRQAEFEPELPVLPSPDVTHPRAAPIRKLTSGSLLDAAVAETEEQGEGSHPSSDPLREYVNQIVAPYQAKKSDRREERQHAEDDRRAAAVRAILRHADFQKLEASWRALSLVVSRLETDESLQVFVLDLTKAELAADLDSTDDLRSTELFRVVADKRDEWALVAADFAFSGTAEDLEILRRLGLVCGSAGASLIAEAEQSMLGCSSVAATPNPRQWKYDISESAAWGQLRAAPVAQWIGLVAPRFLARLPYGKNGTTTDSFAFEEMPAKHGDYLWASPVYLCAMLLGQAFTVDEWDMRPGLFQNVSSMPLYIEQGDDGPEVMPVAEALLTEFAGDKILDLGIMPLMSLKDQDTVRLMRFQSIADPLAPLAGRWD